MDYGRALTDMSQSIFTHRGNNSGVKSSRNWLLNRGTLRPPAWGAVVVPSPSALPTSCNTFATGSVRRKHNCTYQS